MPPEMFEQAVRSLGFGNTNGVPYFGVVGVFGGNPALSPHFAAYCAILRRLVPKEQRGLWCNNPMTLDRAQEMRATFSPDVSNLNVHLDRAAYDLFKLGWPEAHVVGLETDSRHSPPFVAMKDVVKRPCPDCLGRGEVIVTINPGFDGTKTCEACKGTGGITDEDRIRELVSRCPINQGWSAMMGMFRGQLRAWFCEVAGAQSILHQDDPDYPDTGVDPTILHQRIHTGDGLKWWECGMRYYIDQVRKHCWDCGVPLNGYGELSQSKDGKEQCSRTHEGVYRPKRKERQVEVATDLVQLEVGRISNMTRYLQNAKV